MPLSRQEGDQTHIEVVREPDYEPERRRRPNRAPSRIPGRSRPQHADTIRDEAGVASAEVAAAREAHGIDPARLMVLSFEAVNFDPREVFETRFGAWIVEERLTKVADDQRYRLLVQFPDAEAVGRFQQEITEYRDDSDRTRALPPALRANFFDSLESVRPPSREDRVGARLRLLLDAEVATELQEPINKLVQAPAEAMLTLGTGSGAEGDVGPACQRQRAPGAFPRT